MPELPEVETVRRGLEGLLVGSAIIVRVRHGHSPLRRAFPRDLHRRLQGAVIVGVRRRAKYLIFDTPQVHLLSHLGMTGTWRVDRVPSPAAHDHCMIDLADGRQLVYRDPRRFGLIDLIESGGESTHLALRDLGPEPTSDGFTTDHLWRLSRGRRGAIKSLIMDQRIVVGIGNIYAAEALFGARIDPRAAAGGLAASRLGRLVTAIQGILQQAIDAGGSTISDYRQADGGSGSFQDRFQVYGRLGAPCPRCGTRLSGGTIAGRSTVWCGRCQR